MSRAEAAAQRPARWRGGAALLGCPCWKEQRRAGRGGLRGGWRARRGVRLAPGDLQGLRGACVGLRAGAVWVGRDLREDRGWRMAGLWLREAGQGLHGAVQDWGFARAGGGCAGGWGGGFTRRPGIGDLRGAESRGSRGGPGLRGWAGAVGGGTGRPGIGDWRGRAGAARRRLRERWRVPAGGLALGTVAAGTTCSWTPPASR